MGIVGAGFSSLGAGHNAADVMMPANGGAFWLGTRVELGGGGIVDGWTGDMAFAIGLGSVVQMVEGVTRTSASARPGIVMRGGRFQFTFAMMLEQSMYTWSRRSELVTGGWFTAFTPGVELGLGAAF
jgi:hypothetical protein